MAYLILNYINNVHEIISSRTYFAKYLLVQF